MHREYKAQGTKHKAQKVRQLASALLLLLAIAAAAPPIYSQGCVMCRTSAAAGGEEAMKAFDLAVLVLLVPTILLFVGILAFAFRYRNHPRADSEEPPTWQSHSLSASKDY